MTPPADGNLRQADCPARRDIPALAGGEFDLLVLGGGIYGAWTAYDAVLRGLKVALIDKGDWADGTSSASSKLIHGGLRYLEHFDFKLVRKSLLERQSLLETAPHRVWPLRFGVPVYRGGRLGAFRLHAGLFVYDWLAGKLPAWQAYQHLSGDAVKARFPCLEPHGLRAGFTYFDAQTDDARFVFELVDGAAAQGAVCANYCAAVEFNLYDGLIAGVRAQDLTTGQTFPISARQVVDATGRWTNQLPKPQQALRLAKGIHLVMPGIGMQEALLLTAHADGRVFFIIPWYGLTLVGTTDTDYRGDLDELQANQDEMAYLLDEANLALPQVNWTEQDIIGAFAGLRVLQSSKAAHPSAASRDWALIESAQGLLSSIGGKLTSAREDAGIIVDAVCHKLKLDKACPTFGHPLPWLAHKPYPELLAESRAKAEELGIDAGCVEWLVRRFGERVSGLFALCAKDQRLAEKIRPELPFIWAEITFCAEQEMVVHLDDLLRRRLPLTILARLTADEWRKIGGLVCPILGWDAARLVAETKRCRIQSAVSGDWQIQSTRQSPS